MSICWKHIFFCFQTFKNKIPVRWCMWIRLLRALRAFGHNYFQNSHKIDFIAWVMEFFLRLLTVIFKCWKEKPNLVKIDWKSTVLKKTGLQKSSVSVCVNHIIFLLAAQHSAHSIRWQTAEIFIQFVINDDTSRQFWMLGNSMILCRASSKSNTAYRLRGWGQMWCGMWILP